MTRWVWPGLLALLLATPLFAGAPPDTYEIVPGDFIVGDMPLASMTGHKFAKLCFTPTGFDDHDTQTLRYQWQVSVDNGATWRDWMGGTMHGGPVYGMDGQLLTAICGYSPPPGAGPHRIRLEGTLDSPTAITLTLFSEAIE